MEISGGFWLVVSMERFFKSSGLHSDDVVNIEEISNQVVIRPIIHHASKNQCLK